MAHDHTVNDSDKHFSIDPVTRKIVNECGKVVLMQHDHNSERFTFSVPKEVEGHDMTLCNRIYIHYLNVELAELGEEDDEKAKVEQVEIDGVVYAPTGTVYADIDESTDVKVDTSDKTKVVCSWLISRNATQLVGELNFVVRFACIDDDGTEVYGWSTDIYEGIFISPGIYNTNVIVEEYSDILEKWRQDLVLANVVKQYTPQQARAELGAAGMTKTTVTLSMGGWSNKKQTVSVAAATADNVVIPSPIPEDCEVYSDYGIKCVAQASKTLTFQCDDVPNEEITVNVVILD